MGVPASSELQICLMALYICAVSFLLKHRVIFFGAWVVSALLFDFNCMPAAKRSRKRHAPVKRKKTKNSKGRSAGKKNRELATHMATQQLVTFLQLGGKKVSEATPRAKLEAMYGKWYRERSAKS